ncbi:hypothetical protein BESB_030070 [Besnoitia besnoiti]|uniref:B-cell receptor-associated 31-like protein n=1 Tax=Besnoitia besnoiti TaxID=94643 RepID=A0A2A9M657_BESBE|nr:hypothetical protein BESB_030070 [Besnoitia besnoiti]PFH31133.1 hypothetical protein BESB_030070 [Besnoitia besnoiti]
MKEIAFFILPLGGVLAVLLCTPLQFLQRACISFSCLQLSVGRRFSLRISSAFFFYSLFRFASTCLRVLRDSRAFDPEGPYGAQAPAGPWGAPAPSAARGLSLDVRRQAQILRHQRNFWITLSAVFIWLFVWILAKLLHWYWREIEAREKQVAELQQRRRAAAARPAALAPAPSPPRPPRETRPGGEVEMTAAERSREASGEGARETPRGEDSAAARAPTSSRQRGSCRQPQAQSQDLVD